MQKKIIIFMHSLDYPICTRREILDNIKDPKKSRKNQKESINRAIRRFIEIGVIAKPRIRDLTRIDLDLIHPSQRPDLLELQYTTKVKEFLKIND